MRSFFVILTVFLLSSMVAKSQSKLSKKAVQLQFEAFGPAGLLSFNLDSRLTNMETGIGFRIGLGGAPLGLLGKSCNDGAQISLPVGLNYLIGSDKQLIELGAGFVPVIIAGTKRFCVDENDPHFFSDETESYWYLLTGYRYQPSKKRGLTYRIFVSPLFQKKFPVKLWAGASVGIRL